jgi:hypothetical protein
METTRRRILTIFMGILFLLAVLDILYMRLVSGDNLVGFSFYLIGNGLSLSFFVEWSISKEIIAKKFTTSFEKIRWSRIGFSVIVMTYAPYSYVTVMNYSLLFPDLLDLWTWLLLVAYLLSWIAGTYIARHVLYPRGDFRIGFYDALSEKNE